MIEYLIDDFAHVFIHYCVFDARKHWDRCMFIFITVDIWIGKAFNLILCNICLIYEFSCGIF